MTGRIGKTMANGFFAPRIDLTGRIQSGGMDFSQMQISPTKLDSVDEPQSNFKGVMNNLAQGLNQDLNAPDKLLKSAMAGDSSVDIHDVMTAMAKAELSVSVATQVTSKVIQAYDKIMQISV